MAMIHVKARNHPQQTKKRGPKDTIDDRWTPDDLFAELHAEHRFTLDVAASKRNRKCERFFDRRTDGLSQSWSGESVWCNPPYSDIEPWVRKAWKEIRFFGCLKIVMLLPNNRGEQGWWQKYVEPYRDRREERLSTLFIPRRRNFRRPGVRKRKHPSGPPFGLVALIFS